MPLCGTPTITTTDPVFFVFTYRRTQSSLADLKTSIKAEYTSSLTNWNQAISGPNILISTQPNGTAPGIDLVTVKIRRTLAVNNQLFVRLNVAVAAP